eukprot:TRINITY_DN4176_c0_g1_i1.p1 TRINITY_DN4176_c0_g1~~TRINITY_DN4176_c0_g1_i1.p1  ORF type:complete len:394 (+),score=89.50 TRINITY_DN4176_c0_g1_i1:282-1463(+)
MKGVPVVTFNALPDFAPKHPWKRDDFDQMKSQATVAPYGKEEKTVVDTTVRNCLQVEPGQFQLDQAFSLALNKVVAEIQAALAPSMVGGQLRTELYKMVLYDQQSFFKPHVDTPRDELHIGSLVVVPPCKHVGGELVLRFGTESKSLNFSTAKKTACRWAAFFTDVEHEILPLTKGFRVSLLYNLYRPKDFKIELPKAVAEISLADKIKNFIAAWKEANPTSSKPFELGLILEQKYPASSLKPKGLKGNDLDLFATLQQAGLDLRLIPFEIRFGGYGNSDDGRYTRLEDIEDPVIEIDELDVSTKPEGKQKGTTGFPSRSITEDAFVWITKNFVERAKTMKKLDSHIEGSGNEGCDWHQKYAHSAIAVNVSGVRDQRPYTLEHSQRRYEYYGV